jgi:hypothetical protein
LPLIEKSPDADLLREMIGFAAQRLMELEVEGLTGATYARRIPNVSPSATAIAIEPGRHAPAPLSCASRSCVRAATSRASRSCAGWPRRPSRRLMVRRRGGRKRALGRRAPMVVPQRANERWSLDFVADQFIDGRRVRILAVVDDCTRECLALVADTSIPASG